MTYKQEVQVLRAGVQLLRNKGVILPEVVGMDFSTN